MHGDNSPFSQENPFALPQTNAAAPQQRMQSPMTAFAAGGAPPQQQRPPMHGGLAGSKLMRESGGGMQPPMSPMITSKGMGAAGGLGDSPTFDFDFSGGASPAPPSPATPYFPMQMQQQMQSVPQQSFQLSSSTAQQQQQQVNNAASSMGAWNPFDDNSDPFGFSSTGSTAAPATTAAGAGTSDFDFGFGIFGDTEPQKAPPATATAAAAPAKPPKPAADSDDDSDDSDSDGSDSDESSDADDSKERLARGESLKPKAPASSSIGNTPFAGLPPPQPGSIRMGLASLSIPDEANQNESTFKQFLLTPVPRTDGNDHFMCSVIYDGNTKSFRMVHQTTSKVILTAVKRRDGLKMFDPSLNFSIMMHFSPGATPPGSGGATFYGGSTAPTVIGKVRSNVTGSVYEIYDSGLNPNKAKGMLEARRELGAVKVERVTGIFTRRRVTIAVPRDEQYRRPSGRGGDTLLERRDKGDASVQVIANHLPERPNRLPRLEHFEGLAQRQSIKNVIAHDPSEATRGPVYILGKSTKTTFNLLFRWPISPIVAFGAAIASVTSNGVFVCPSALAFLCWAGGVVTDASLPPLCVRLENNSPPTTPGVRGPTNPNKSHGISTGLCSVYLFGPFPRFPQTRGQRFAFAFLRISIFHYFITFFQAWTL